MDHYEEYILKILRKSYKNEHNKYEIVKIIGKRMLEITNNPHVEFEPCIQSYIDKENVYDDLKIAFKEYEMGFLGKN